MMGAGFHVPGGLRRVVRAVQDGEPVEGVQMHVLSGTVGSNGEVTFYLTDDLTAGGEALFTDVLHSTVTAVVNATAAADVIYCSLKSLSVDLKTLVYRCTKGRATLSSLINPTVLDAPSGTVVSLMVIGRV